MSEKKSDRTKDSEFQKVDEKREVEILRRMLNTSPKPHKTRRADSKKNAKRKPRGRKP